MDEILDKLGLLEINSGASTGSWVACTGEVLECLTPIYNKVIATVRQAAETDYDLVAATAAEAFLFWRMVPAPKRGEVVRQMGNVFRDHKKELGALISLEVGKIPSEAEGEVQEMIDMCDFAVGQSRMLCGVTMHSERPRHRMYEQWHPLGSVGVITAFNFPGAVWAWNAMIALVAGDTVIWKPSSKAPLCAIAIMKIASRVLKENGFPEGILNLVIGSGDTVGECFINDIRLPLISATGSVRMGRRVGQAVAGKPVPTPGRLTCEGKPTPSIGPGTCLWRRASNSAFPDRNNIKGH